MTEIKKKLELLEEQEINEIKNETKRKLNMLDDEINNRLGKFYVDLATLRIKCEFFQKAYEAVPWKRTSKTERLKEEVKNNEDKLLDREIKIFRLLTDLEYEKHDALHNIVVLKSKLVKLEILPERIDGIKNLVLSS